MIGGKDINNRGMEVNDRGDRQSIHWGLTVNSGGKDGANSAHLFRCVAIFNIYHNAQYDHNLHTTFFVE